MPAVLALVGIPLAFSITMLLLLVRSHSIGPVLGPALIASLAIFFVAVVRWVRRLESSET
jgi:hypothetical protein